MPNVPERRSGRARPAARARGHELPSARADRRQHSGPSFHRQSNDCTGAPLVTEPQGADLPGPGKSHHREATYPATTGCKLEVFKPVLYASPTTTETDSPSGLDIEFSDPQFLGCAASPSELKSGDRHPAEGSRSTPMPQTARPPAQTPRRTSAARQPAECPDSSKIGTFRSAPELRAHSKARYTSANRSPATSTGCSSSRRLRDHAKLVGTVKPDPLTGQLTDEVRRPAAGAVRRVPGAPLRLRSRPDRDPDPLQRSTRPRPTSSRGTHRLPNRTRSQVFGLDSGPHGTACPGQMRPFNPRLVAGTAIGGRCPHRLHPEARSRRRRPVPRQARLHDAARADRRAARGRLLPGGGDRRGRARTPDGAEQAEPELPASREIGTLQRRRRARLPSVPRGRKDLHGRPFQRGAALAGRDHAGPRRSLRLRRTWWCGWRCTSIRSSAHVVADSETVP